MGSASFKILYIYNTLKSLSYELDADFLIFMSIPDLIVCTIQL
jgi:hypothetical protein